MSQPKIPDRARNYKEDQAPVASQKMVSRLLLLVHPYRTTLAPASHPRPRSRFQLQPRRALCTLDRWCFDQRV